MVERAEIDHEYDEDEVPAEGHAQSPALGNNYQEMIIKMKEYS
jgi:hypothetical protein